MSTILNQDFEARFDDLENLSVLFAPGRAKRPASAPSPLCPACHPHLAPPPVYIFPEHLSASNTNWDVRVVPNKFPSLTGSGANQRYRLGSGRRGIKQPAGNCEVVFETGRHIHPVYARTPIEIEYFLRALITRFKAARSDPHARFWFAFKNLGVPAGGTLEHEHWQVYKLPFIPPAVRNRYSRAARYYNRTGHSRYRHVYDSEMASGDRIVGRFEHFVSFVPFAASMPYEITIAPLRDSADFSTMTAEERLSLAACFRDVVARLYHIYPDLSFNVMLHTAAFKHASVPWFCWHITILPRRTIIAGVELGINVMINSVVPEIAAANLRAVSIN